MSNNYYEKLSELSRLDKEGATARRIAAELGVSKHWVAKHRNQVRGRLCSVDGCSNGRIARGLLRSPLLQAPSIWGRRPCTKTS